MQEMQLHDLNQNFAKGKSFWIIKKLILMMLNGIS